MSSASYPTPRTSSWPWWMDPYSDNPIAFGVLFLLLIALMIASLLIFRILFIHAPGATPITPPGLLLRGGPLSALASLL